MYANTLIAFLLLFWVSFYFDTFFFAHKLKIFSLIINHLHFFLNFS